MDSQHTEASPDPTEGRITSDVLVMTGEELLDRARRLGHSIEERIREVAGPSNAADDSKQV